MGLFWKNVLQDEERTNSGDGVLLLVLKSSSVSSGAILRKMLQKKRNGKNSGDGVVFIKKVGLYHKIFVIKGRSTMQETFQNIPFCIKLRGYCFLRVLCK